MGEARGGGTVRKKKKETLIRTFHLRSKHRSSAANRTYVFMSQDKQPCHGGRSPKLMMSSDSLQQNPLLKQNERGREGGKCGGSAGPARGMELKRRKRKTGWRKKEKKKEEEMKKTEGRPLTSSKKTSAE